MAARLRIPLSENGRCKPRTCHSQNWQGVSRFQALTVDKETDGATQHSSRERGVMETRDINQWFKNQNANLKRQALNRLSAAGLVIGVSVKRKDGAKYMLTSIHFAGISPYGGYISLHGQKYKKNGKLGEHEHLIGFPHEVSPI
jgi:hypothetical protein